MTVCSCATAWSQWTIKAAWVKVHHWPLFLRMVRWCIRLTCLILVFKVIRPRLVQVRQKSQKKKKDFSCWRSAIAFLYLFLLRSLLRLTPFLSQNNKSQRVSSWHSPRLFSCQLLVSFLECLIQFNDFLSILCGRKRKPKKKKKK